MEHVDVTKVNVAPVLVPYGFPATKNLGLPRSKRSLFVLRPRVHRVQPWQRELGGAAARANP